MIVFQAITGIIIANFKEPQSGASKIQNVKKTRYYTFGYICVLLAFLVSSGAGTALAIVTSHEFSRYQVILDKKPFGEVTPSEDAQPQAALSEIITKEIEMKSIIDDGSGIRIGLLDKKTNKNISLGVGENHEGLQLVSVDYDNEEAVVKKNSETVVLKLRPDKAKDLAAGPAAVPALMNELPFQAPAPSSPSPATRRPFFSDLKTRRASPFQPAGTNTLPFQARSAESFFKVSTGAFPHAQSPFGLFQVPKAGAAPGAFQQIMPGASNVPNPFMAISPAGGQVNPQNQNTGTDGKGATINQLIQEQSGGQVQPIPETEIPAEDAAQ